MTQMQPPFDRLPLCDRVRHSCRWVSDRAALVTIAQDELDRVAEQLVSTMPPVGPMETEPPSEGPLGPAEIDRATLTLALDAINFGSGYHDVIRKRPGLSGSRTMAASLEEYVDATGPLDPERLRRITVADCSQIFGQELDGGAQEELMSLFAAALNDLGQWLDSKGGVDQAIEASDRSAQAFAHSLTEMVYYRDVERYEAESVSFYKRAQISSADLSRRVRPDLFTDLDRLTAFADNLVPHVLRMRGALRYTRPLSETIDRGILLEPGGAADVEIRAAAVECVERLADRTGLRAMDIDGALWTLGGSAEMKAVPRHRARSVFY